MSNPTSLPPVGVARREPPIRPVTITIICVLGILGALFIIPLVLSGVARQVGAWYPPYIVFSAVVGLICMFGFWTMRRWGVVAYTTFCLINQVVLLVAGKWNPLAILLPGIVIGIGIAYYSRMR